MSLVPPKLSDLIRTWLKTELPKAPQMQTDNKLTFDIRQGNQSLFRVSIDDEYLIVSSGFNSLEEIFAVGEDRVVGGKWSAGAEILACDPDFFPKLAYHMTWSARVVTMGAFTPGGTK